MAKSRRPLRRRNSEQLSLSQWLHRGAQAFVRGRKGPQRSSSAAGERETAVRGRRVQGPRMFGGRRRAAKTLSLSTHRPMWVDPITGTPIRGIAWRDYYKPSSSKRKKKAVAKAKRTGRRKGRKLTAKQRKVALRNLAKARRARGHRGVSVSAAAPKGLFRRGRKGRYRKARRVTTMINPRKNPSHRHRRRNPSGGGGIAGAIKNTLKTAVPAVVGGVVMAAVDSKLLAGKSAALRVGGKLAAAAAVGLALRKRPQTAAIMMGAMLGTLGYEQGIQFLGGGVVAPTKSTAISALSALVYEDRRAMSALVGANGELVGTVPSLSGTELPDAGIPFDPISLG